MHWKDIELLQFGHNLAQIIWGCGRQMKTAGKRVNLFDTADLLRSSQRIYNSGMAAGGNHDQTPVTQAEASCVFVPMLVGLRFASELVFAEMVVHIAFGSQPRPSLVPTSTQVFGSTCSMLVFCHGIQLRLCLDPRDVTAGGRVRNPLAGVPKPREWKPSIGRRSDG
jgi:hypothetical protein